MPALCFAKFFQCVIMVQTLQNANLIFAFTEYHNMVIFISVKLDWCIEIATGLGFFSSYNYYNINFFSL